MTSRDFCFWLQGFFEINNEGGMTKALTPGQAEIVKKHLAMVFKHEIDPSFPSDHQEALNDLHLGGGATGVEIGGAVIRC